MVDEIRIVVKFPPGHMHYMGIHPYSFRSGERADVIGIVASDQHGKEPRLAYLIRFPEDGKEDYAPIIDAANYDVWFTQYEEGNVSIKLEDYHYGLLERARNDGPLSKSRDVGTAPLHALESVHYLKVIKQGGKQSYIITEKGIAALEARSRKGLQG